MALASALESTHVAGAHVEGQQHPIKLYLVVWGWLFVLSSCSYLVDYFGLQGYLRWSLILMLMILKAGLIVAVFMHMAWERLALMYAILVPPVLVLVFRRPGTGVKMRMMSMRRGQVDLFCLEGPDGGSAWQELSHVSATNSLASWDFSYRRYENE